MDEMTLLRDLEADTPPPGARANHEARMRLRYAMAHEQRAARPAHGRTVAAVSGALTLAAVGGALALVGDPTPGAPEPPVQLSAAAVDLGIAADAVGKASTGPIPRDDQYYFARELRVLTPVDGGRPERIVDEWWTSVGGEAPSISSELGTVWTTMGTTVSFDALRRLPTDPGQLLLAIRAWPEDGRESPDPMSEDDFESAYGSLTSLLFNAPSMPPSLRAAIFEALARIPGVRIAKDAEDARGRRGLGITRATGHIEQMTILDPRTYAFLGLSATIDWKGAPHELVTSRLENGIVDRLRERP